jgi:hypothetical protein
LDRKCKLSMQSPFGAGSFFLSCDSVVLFFLSDGPRPHDHDGGRPLAARGFAQEVVPSVQYCIPTPEARIERHHY